MKAKALIVGIFLIAGLALMSLNVQSEQKSNNIIENSEFEGTLVCVSCDLKKTEGARAACTEFGHRHALKTKDGKYISFLENKFSADLIKGKKYHNKQISVAGIFYADANLLDVEKFEVEGAKKSWCNMCKAMDGHAVAKAE